MLGPSLAAEHSMLSFAEESVNTPLAGLHSCMQPSPFIASDLALSRIIEH